MYLEDLNQKRFIAYLKLYQPLLKDFFTSKFLILHFLFM